jgi:bifunctional DNA-binding transcriptional regulator/antitoxin component of YhaV-PrlF toxin-antitoxin module
METKERRMPKMRVRDGKLTVTLPKEIRSDFDALDGEEIDISAEDGRIVLTPKEDSAERHPDIDAAIAEGLADERAGRLSPAFASVKEMKLWLKTEDGMKFVKE